MQAQLPLGRQGRSRWCSARRTSSFRSVFISADPAVQLAGRPEGHATSASARRARTSGHLMPRSFLLAAGIEPEQRLPPRRLQRRARRDDRRGRRRQGRRRRAEHLGLGQARRREARSTPRAVRVFYTTPTYYDYNWTVHAADAGGAAREARRRRSSTLVARRRRGHARCSSCSARRASCRRRPTNYKGIEAAGAQRRAALKPARGTTSSSQAPCDREG
ncbi:MAG: hypothetical protein MZW92_20970 [Comamonadaceae bacterium]|nr:hypothetical protein [Comamonadaceae bacterium]